MKKIMIFALVALITTLVACSNNGDGKNSTILFMLRGKELKTADVSIEESKLTVFDENKKIKLNKGDKVRISVGKNQKNGLTGIKIKEYNLIIKQGEEKTITLDKAGTFTIYGLDQVQCITTPCEPLEVEKGTLVVKK